MDLRPLGFGEIFDRAITLYVRNFWPFLAIVLVLIVPLAVIQYVLDSSQLAQFDQAIRVFTHPNAPAPALASLFSSPGDIAAIAAMLLIYYALWPFVFVAVAIGVARLYSGRPVEFGACYRSVMPHWGAILLTQLVAVVVFIAWYVAFFVVLVAAGVVTALLAQASIVVGNPRLRRGARVGAGVVAGARAGAHRARLRHERRRHRKRTPDRGGRIGIRPRLHRQRTSARPGLRAGGVCGDLWRVDRRFGGCAVGADGARGRGRGRSSPPCCVRRSLRSRSCSSRSTTSTFASGEKATILRRRSSASLRLPSSRDGGSVATRRRRRYGVRGDFVPVRAPASDGSDARCVGCTVGRR